MQNGKFVQLKGPFKKDAELVDLIRSAYAPFQHIRKIGIQDKGANKYYVYLNGTRFEMGTTGVLEINNVALTSVRFGQDVSEQVLIDCIID